MEVFDLGKIKKEILKASFCEKSQSASQSQKEKSGSKENRETSGGGEAHLGPAIAE